MRTFAELLSIMEEAGMQPQIDQQLAQMQVGYIHHKLQATIGTMNAALTGKQQSYYGTDPNAQKSIQYSLAKIQAVQQKFNEFIAAFQQIQRELISG